jgi:uncharacterized cupredoxin-like copper-binding protein
VRWHGIEHASFAPSSGAGSTAGNSAGARATIAASADEEQEMTERDGRHIGVRPGVQRFVATLAAGLLVAAVVGGVGVHAQQATPIATEQTAQGTTVFPASIHQGTCDVLGPVAYPLSNIGVPEGGEVVGQPAIPAFQGETTLPGVKLDDLISGEYVLAVSESERNVDTIVACGKVGGTHFDNHLLFGLSPTDVRGIAGAALLTQQQDGSLHVTVYVITNAALPATATPAAPASPAATEPAAQPTQPAQPTATSGGGGSQAQTAVTVEMVDIAFKPTEFTIPANTDVTITLKNSGATTHNFSITDHNNPNVKNLGISVDVDPGQTKTVTVNAPSGDYYYFCNIPGHEQAGMHGTMHVQ